MKIKKFGTFENIESNDEKNTNSNYHNYSYNINENLYSRTNIKNNKIFSTSIFIIVLFSMVLLFTNTSTNNILNKKNTSKTQVTKKVTTRFNEGYIMKSSDIKINLSLKVKVEGTYSAIEKVELGSNYPWIEEPVVEPWKLTTLTAIQDIDEDGDTYEYTWTYHNGVKNVQLKGTKIQIMLKTTGKIDIVLEEKNLLTGLTNRQLTKTVRSLYVRRELRSLLPADREAYLSAMFTLWQIPTSEGQELYGDNYMGIDDFVKAHLIKGSDIACDHIHDSYGFFTQHMAYDMRFEKALQSVDPSVALHYWDYTIDFTELEKTGDYDGIKSIFLFTDEWMGETDTETNAISNSRWAYTKIPVAGEEDAEISNSYGYLRSPWNANASPYVTRSWELCGVDVSEVFAYPTCEVHYSVLNYDSISDFTLDSSYAPHGPVHMKIGGTFGCENSFEDLASLGFSTELIKEQYARSFQILKNSWRAGILTCPDSCDADTPQEECLCDCGDIDYDDYLDDTMWTSYCDTIPGAKYRINLEGYDRVRFVELSCTAGTLDGDHLEASSPVDPTFWPIHPTLGRLWSWKMINGGFEDTEWGESDCEGHNKDDTVLVTDIFPSVGQQVYTNEEVWYYSDPNKEYTDFIYDDFVWDHCSDVGLDFNSFADND